MRAPAIRGAARRTQASLAVSGDGERWFLINASPDLREQIQAQTILHPATRPALLADRRRHPDRRRRRCDRRACCICANARLSLSMASERVLDVLKANPIFGVLAEDCVRREAVPLGQAFEPHHVDGSGSGLAGRAVRRAGQGRALSRDRRRRRRSSPASRATRSASRCAAGGQRLVYIPGCAGMTDAPEAAAGRRLDRAVRRHAVAATTRWSARGLGPKTGQRMGHMSVSGPDGTIAAFRDIPVGRKILVHINNSNPILLDDSAERARRSARRAGRSPMTAWRSARE